MTNQEIIDKMQKRIKKAKADMFAAPVGEKRWDALFLYETYKSELKKFNSSLEEFEKRKDGIIDIIKKF